MLEMVGAKVSVFGFSVGSSRVKRGDAVRCMNVGTRACILGKSGSGERRTKKKS